MKDSDFRKLEIRFPPIKDWKTHSRGESIVVDGTYRPDLSFSDPKANVVCVIESSSTGDRKVGIGELLMADKFFTDNSINGILIFSLCGSSTTAIRPDTQKEYLAPYFDYLKSAHREFGVHAIYIIREEDFADANWIALSDAFLNKCEQL